MAHGSNKFFGVAIIVAGLGAYAVGFGFPLGRLSFLMPVIAFIIGMVLLTSLDSPAPERKDYKSPEPAGPMKMHYLFYIVGVIFIFASVWYFTREFIAELPNMVKLILLIVSVIIAFVVAEFLRGADI